MFSDIYRHRKANGTFVFVVAARWRQGTVCRPGLGDRIIDSVAIPRNTKTGMLPILQRRSVLSYTVPPDVKDLEVCSHGNKSSVFWNKSFLCCMSGFDWQNILVPNVVEFFTSCRIWTLQFPECEQVLPNKPRISHFSLYLMYLNLLRFVCARRVRISYFVKFLHYKP